MPWKEIIGMRNRLVHEYDRIEVQVVWETLTIEIPILLPKIEKLAPPTLRPRDSK
ncbi:MAG: DUF86 domain-containing protein [Planctomycetes bacterium]|nr:DUF86 domain-containing protein [Planctomycetota bacterium]